MRNNFLHAVSLMAVAALLSGCNPQPGTSELKQRVVAAQSHGVAGKPGASIRLKNQQPIMVESLGAHSVTIGLLVPHSSAGADMGSPNPFLRVAVSVDGDIEISSDQKVFDFDQIPSGEYSLPLQINAHKTGRHYIKLHVSLHESGVISARSITAIVQVGDKPITAQKTARTYGEAENDVIILPAQETISSQ